MNQAHTVMPLIALVPIILLGLSFWFTAQTRRGVLFGVSVPVSFAESSEARRTLRLYRLRIVLLTALAAACCALPVSLVLPWLSSAAVPTLLLGGILLWQLARKETLPHRIAAPLERTSGLSPDSDLSAIWIGAMLLSLTPMAGVWIFLQRHWQQIPSRFPIHWNSAFVADAWVHRTAVSVAMPLILGAAIILFLAFAAAFMRFVPVPNRQRASRILLPTLAALAWTFSVLFCWIAMLPVHDAALPASIGLVTLWPLLSVAAIIAWMVQRLMRTQGQETYDGTPDSGWRAGGLLYYNPADAAVMVPKRFGWGWTLNFARPATWGYCAAVLFLLGVIGVVHLLVK